MGAVSGAAGRAFFVGEPTGADLVLALVTTLLAVYGRFAWSPLLGPLAAYGLWKLERYAAAARGEVDVA